MAYAPSLEHTLARLAGFPGPVSREHSLARLAGLSYPPVSAEYAAAHWAGLLGRAAYWAGLPAGGKPPSLEFSLSRVAGLSRHIAAEAAAALITIPRTLVQDTFSDTNGTLLENHTPDIGGRWTNISTGNASIQSNTLFPSSGAASRFYVNASLPAADYEMSFTVSAHFGLNGFMAHRQGNNFYYAIRTQTAYQIVTLISGVPTVLVALTEALSLPATLMLRVRKGDDYLRLFANGVEKIATNNAALRGGQGGLVCQSFGGTTIIDDFLAQT